MVFCFFFCFFWYFDIDIDSDISVDIDSDSDIDNDIDNDLWQMKDRWAHCLQIYMYFLYPVINPNVACT